ncbi:HlyD family secretion protein [Hyphomonas johnsonii]|uniref:Multidrug resistance protein A n=1 Tax=Hyphomonas johnsonii MHS-2 TaxID=1280950 RepID=A0A059FU29_9PROT|nr:HlyD family secretion protein [Hyphomonas johnsonii]KCZ94092.1 multidrug resistance protein A [Hyphomonas johnsonii MHS-2]
MAKGTKKRVVGVVLCLGAVLVGVGGWIVARSASETSTDNAYVRGEVTSLAAKISGYVVSVEIDDNQPVHAGDVLFRIDDQDYRARLAQAEANLEAARARLANVETETELQRALIRQAQAQQRSSAADEALSVRDSERMRRLVQSGAVSQALVDESDAKRTRAEAAVSAASATVDAQQQKIAVLASQKRAAAAAIAQAEALRDLAKIDLDSTVVRSPVDGIVGNRQVRVGRLVAPGSPVLDIVPANEVWVVANFKETQLRFVRLGQPVRISIDGYPDRVFSGVVDSFAPGSGSSFSLLPSDNATGNFVRVVQRVPVKIRFADEPLPERLVPGLSARVEIDRDQDR